MGRPRLHARPQYRTHDLQLVSRSLLARFTFIIAEICLLAGSVRNAYHTKYRAKLNVENLSCETIRKGVFGAGAAFTFFTCIFGEFYYIYYSKAKATTHHDDHAGVGMTHYK